MEVDPSRTPLTTTQSMIAFIWKREKDWWAYHGIVLL